MFRLAAAGKPLHHDFADKAAAVDGEMVDVIGNMPVVRAFGGSCASTSGSTHARSRDGRAPAQPALPRAAALLHAVVTIVLTIGLLAWAIVLAARRRHHRRCGAGLHARARGAARHPRPGGGAGRRHPAHGAAVGGARHPLVPHELRDHPAAPLVQRGTRSRSTTSPSAIPTGSRSSPASACGSRPASASVWSAARAAASRPAGPAAAFYDVQRGRILIDGQDISRVTQESMREAISVVPQDISLFHRSVMENIRYGRPNASDAEVLQAAVAAKCRDFIEDAARRLRDAGRRRGVKLSGGQRQRIAIARAFLKDAPICCSTRPPPRSTSSPRRRSARRSAG